MVEGTEQWDEQKDQQGTLIRKIMPFVKLDCNILYSSIWAEDAETCKVWITMLAMSDQNGLVSATAPGIASASFVPTEETRRAIEILESPDIDSKSSTYDGRRISRVEGGYLILNYDKYRERSYSTSENAQYMREYRAKKKLELTKKSKEKSYDVITLSLHSASVSLSSDVLSYLNSKTGKKFKNTKYIEARLKDGYTVEQLKQVIDVKCCDPHFVDNKQYLNPTTLFRPSHIDNYINQSPNDFNGIRNNRSSVGLNTTPTKELTLEDKINHKKSLIEVYEGNFKLCPERWGKPLEKIKAELKELEDKQSEN